MKKNKLPAERKTNSDLVPASPRSNDGNGYVSDEMREILQVLLAFRSGDFSVRLPQDWTGVYGKIADTLNDITALTARLGDETARVSLAVGKKGRLKQRLSLPGAAGGWADKVVSINTLIDDLVWPTAEVTRTISAVAKGDLTQPMALEVEGRPL